VLRQTRTSRSALLLVALVSAAVALLLPAPPADARACGSFTKRISADTTYVIRVSASGGLACRSAMGIMRDFWFERGRRRHGGPATYQTWWTLRRWPGFRCTTGAGSGVCRRGARQARYTIPPPD